MTKQEAIELAVRIPKEANRPVRAKAGTTNGQGVVHVAVTDGNRSSRTLASVGEWLASPLNKRNADHTPRAKKPRRDEADEATVLTATDPHTVYSPED